ncbi:MAG: site-specific integrase [Eubacteriaceae bacterium]|jgi:integrase|nr:site-specific integrase [Eubacteriaceae bacterium]
MATNTKIGTKEYYRTTATVGYDHKGKQIQKQFYGKTKKEAERKKYAFLKNHEHGIVATNDSVSKAMHNWLWSVIKIKSKASTFERYEINYRCHIKPSEIAYIKATEITSSHIQKFYNTLFKNDTSVATIKQIHRILTYFFNYLLNERTISINPCKNVVLPIDADELIDNEEIFVFSDEDIQKIYTLRNSRVKFIMLFALFSGLRIGEILALTSKDVEDNIVSVTKSVRIVRIFDTETTWHYETVVSKPKTKTSIRTVPLPSSFHPYMLKIHELNKQQQRDFDYEPTDLLFPSLYGTFLNARNVTRSYKRALKSLDIEYRKFHSLRHTYATKLFEAGVDVLTISKLLGHTTTQTTEIYAHVLKTMKTNVVESLNSIFADNNVKIMLNPQKPNKKSRLQVRDNLDIV